MTTHPNPTKQNPSGDPLPPIPPVGPVQTVGTFLNAVKVFLVADIGLALKYAWSANAHFTDWDKFANLDHWTALAQVTINGFIYGLIPGAVLGLLVLLAAFAGPSLWSWLGPIILIAATKTMNFVRGVSRSIRGLPDTENNSNSEKNG